MIETILLVTPGRSTSMFHFDIHKARLGLLAALVLVSAGIVLDSLFSAAWALDDGLLLAAAAIIMLVLLLIRDGAKRDRPERQR